MLANRQDIPVARFCAPIGLVAGEIFVLPSTEPIPLGSSHDFDAARAEEVFARSRVGGAAVHNGSGDVFLAGRVVVVNGRHAEVRLYASHHPPSGRRARQRCAGCGHKARVFTGQEQGQGHCQVGNLSLAIDVL